MNQKKKKVPCKKYQRTWTSLIVPIDESTRNRACPVYVLVHRDTWASSDDDDDDDKYPVVRTIESD